MMLIAKVEKSWTLPSFVPGCGCAIGIEFVNEDARLRAKDLIQLRTPDGYVRDTYVAGFSGVKRLLLYGGGSAVFLCLPRDFKMQDVPPGTNWRE